MDPFEVEIVLNQISAQLFGQSCQPFKVFLHPFWDIAFSFIPSFFPLSEITPLTLSDVMSLFQEFGALIRK